MDILHTKLIMLNSYKYLIINPSSSYVLWDYVLDALPRIDKSTVTMEASLPQLIVS